MLLGAGGNAGINFIKSLRLSGESYWILAADLSSYKVLPAPADHKVVVPPASRVGRLEALNAICRRYDIDLVHAQPDPEVRFLAEHQRDLAAPCFPIDLEILKQFADKAYCQQTWRDKLGIEFVVSAAVDTDEKTFDRLHAICGKVWVRARTGAGSKAALPVTTLAQARAWINYWVEARGMREDDFVLCEYLPGPEYAVQTVWHKGELIQTQARERLEFVFGSIMPSGQSSTPSLARSVRIPAVTETAHAAIRAIDPLPHGIYCVDIRTSQHGDLVPTEVNYGRFFTTSDFFAAYGCNGPHAYVQLALTGKADKAIDVIPPDIRWSRGLDREPLGYGEADTGLVEVWP